MNPPKIACPKCGLSEATIVCRLCKTDKLPRISTPAPAEGYYDIWEEIRAANALLYPEFQGPVKK